MLKRIETGEVELGMFIHKLEGSWFSHPFWKSRFLLEDPVLLGKLHDSAVPAVIIDTERSRRAANHIARGVQDQYAADLVSQSQIPAGAQADQIARYGCICRRAGTAAVNDDTKSAVA